MNKFSKWLLFLFSGPLFAFICIFILQPKEIIRFFESGHLIPSTDFFLIWGLSSFGILIEPLWNYFFSRKYLLLSPGIIGTLFCLGSMSIIKVIKVASSGPYVPCNGASSCSIDYISPMSSGTTLLLALAIGGFSGICSSISAYFYKKLKYTS